MRKVKILLDMDEVMADFQKARTDEPQRRNPAQMYAPGFFVNLEPVEGALEAVQELYQMENVELEVVSKPVAISPISYTEKAQWIAKWFPYLIDKITLTQNKANIKGDYLIDDREWEGFEGKLIKFEISSGKEGWEKAVQRIKKSLVSETDEIDWSYSDQELLEWDSGLYGDFISSCSRHDDYEIKDYGGDNCIATYKEKILGKDKRFNEAKAICNAHKGKYKLYSSDRRRIIYDGGGN